MKLRVSGSVAVFVIFKLLWIEIRDPQPASGTCLLLGHHHSNVRCYGDAASCPAQQLSAMVMAVMTGH